MADARRGPVDPHADVDPANLTPEQRMLINIRDTLYEGSWDDFAHDLEARLDSRSPVFDIVPASDRLKDTIRSHLMLIERLRAWEQKHGTVLRAPT
jgi:hypothetical protein